MVYTKAQEKLDLRINKLMIILRREFLEIDYVTGATSVNWWGLTEYILKNFKEVKKHGKV